MPTASRKPYSTSAPGITVRNARFTYGGAPLFDGLTADIAGGRWTCVLGASGIGKSSLIRLIAGLGEKLNRVIGVNLQKPFDAFATRLDTVLAVAASGSARDGVGGEWPGAPCLRRVTAILVSVLPPVNPDRATPRHGVAGGPQRPRTRTSTRSPRQRTVAIPARGDARSKTRRSSEPPAGLG